MPCPALRRVGLKHATGELRANVGDRDLQPIEKGALVHVSRHPRAPRDRFAVSCHQEPRLAWAGAHRKDSLCWEPRPPIFGKEARAASPSRRPPRTGARRTRARVPARTSIETGTPDQSDGAADAQSQTLSGPRCSPAQRPATPAYIPRGSRNSPVDSPTGKGAAASASDGIACVY